MSKREHTLRIVTPEQYRQGFRIMGYDRDIPFELIRRQPDGNYLVREPGSRLSRRVSLLDVEAPDA